MRPRSYKGIKTSLNMLCEWAETEEIKDLNHGTVLAFLHWGREERAWEARTFRNHRQQLKTFFTWCLKQQIIQKNPVDGIEKPKIPKTLPRCLSREETQVILNRTRWCSWRYNIERIRNETMLYFLIHTGLRLQEMLDLKLDDIKLPSNEIFISLGKGQKDRIVPIHPKLMPVLRAYLSERKTRRNYSPYLFTGAQSEKPLSGKDVRNVCKKVSQEAGIYFTPHMLRHTFARLCIEAGWDIYKIKVVMGHSNITTTEGYLSVSTAHIKKSFGDIVLV